MDSLIAALSEFHFIRPWWLLALLVPVGIRWFFKTRASRQGINQLVDAHLQAAVVDSPEQHSTRARYLPAIVMSLLIVALAGPSWERLPQPLFQLQQGRVIVLSLSKSMDRSDMSPSRLQRAKFKIEDLLASMPGVLNGLIGFAGEAFVITPLSDDRDTITNLLESLDSDTLPVQGIRAERGLEKARDLLSQVSIDTGEILLVTDRASPLAVSTAKSLSGSGIGISVLEVAPADDSSQSALLKSIANAGRGRYVRITPDDSDIEQLNVRLKNWLSQSRSQSTQSLRNSDQWRDAGPWLLIPALLLSSLMFRQGWLPGILLIGFLNLPRPAAAFEWQSLWMRSDQQQWTAVQAYRNGDLDTALEKFELDDSATGAYNRGNVLAKQQQLQAAIEAYDTALRLKPGFEDARYNRQLVEAALKQQQQQNRDQENSQASDAKNDQAKAKPGQSNESQQQPKDSKPGESQNNADAGSDTPKPSPAQTGDPESASSNQSDTDKPDPATGPPATAESGDKQDPAKMQAQAAAAEQDDGPMDEEAQALELLLRQVPDDPGALLRRKFKYQYQNQQP